MLILIGGVLESSEGNTGSIGQVLSVDAQRPIAKGETGFYDLRLYDSGIYDLNGGDMYGNASR